MKNYYYLLIFAFLFYSCSTILFREGLSISEKEDWLQSGRNEAKTNISDSSYILKPPFKEIWSFNAEAGFTKNALSASDGVLFASCLNGNAFAINIGSGSSIGKLSVKSKSSFSVPVILDDLVIFIFSDGTKNVITGYDYKSGIIKWEKNTGEVLSSPAMKDGKIYYCTKQGNIYKIDGTTGINEWTYRNNYSLHTSPSISNSLLFAGDIKGTLIAVDIEKGDLKWYFKTGDGIYADVSVYKDKIFFGSDDKNFYCLDMDGKLTWKKNLETKFLSSSTFYNDNVICTGIDGNIYSMNINTGDLNWKCETRGTITASPVLNKDKIFVGSFDKYFYCLDATSGKILWKQEFDERIRTTAVIWKNYLIIADDDKSIYCYQ